METKHGVDMKQEKSIREDKYRGVCKALNWNYMQEEIDEEKFNIAEMSKV